MTDIEQLLNDWNDLAEVDPMWAICSSPAKQFGRWSSNDFFRTGRNEIDEILALLHDFNIVVQKGRVLDFGCGIGRLTQALAQHFEECWGVDISPRMIELANSFNSYAHCHYTLNPNDNLELFRDNYFDFVYTSMVLQHIPQPLSTNYLREFMRLLKPGAILMFQIPIGRLLVDNKSAYIKSLPILHPIRFFNKLRGVFLGNDVATRYYRLRRVGLPKKLLYDYFGFRPQIQMHHIEETTINDVLTGAGGEVVLVLKDEEKAGKGLLSATFVARKYS